MHLVDAAHGEIGEGGGHVVVIGDHLRLVVDAGIIARNTRLEIAVAQVVRRIHAEDALGRKPRCRSVARTGRNERGLKLGRFLHVDDVRLDGMRRGEAVREVTLGLVGQVIQFPGVALRIVGEEPLAPQTLAPQLRIAHFAAHGDAQAADVEAVRCPRPGAEHVGIVIVAVLIAHLGGMRMAVLVVIVEVILVSLCIRAEIAFGEFVDVGPIVAPQEVFHLRVVLRTVTAQRKPAVDPGIVAEDVRKTGREVPVQLIGMTLLDHVVRPPAGAVDLLVEGIVLVIVGLVHLLPVEMADVLVVGLPVDLLPCGTDIVLVEGEIARQVTVVVGARVGAVLPRQCRVAVPAEAQRRGQLQLRTVGDVERVVEHHDGFVVVTHAGIALLAVLPAPVGVVIVVAYQVVGLLRGGLLRTAFGGGTQQGQRQAVALAELLFDGGEITERIVVNAVDIGVAALAGRNRKGIRPAVVLIARGIGDHCTETVHRIAVHEAGTQPLAHLRRAGDDVGRTADAAQPDVRGHDTRRHLQVTCGVVQAAPQRPRRIAREGVVEPDAVHVDVLVLRIVTADVEAHLTELVGRDVVEDVLGGRERRRQCLRIVDGLHVELREHGVVDHLPGYVGHQHDRIDVAHLRADAHGDGEGFELGGLELQRVFARRDILDEEITPLIRHHGHVARRHGNLHAVEGHTPRTRNDPAPDAAVLCKGGQRGDGEY